MNNIIALKTNCYNGFTFSEAIEGIKKSGFRYLELHASPNNSLHISRKEPFDRILEVKDIFQKEGLIPIALGGHTNIMDKDIEVELINNLKLAKFFNCSYFVTNIGEPVNASNTEIANRIKYYLPYLEEYNLNMVIELHGPYSKGSKVKEITDIVNSKRVCINYDTANPIFYESFTNEELLEDIERCINSISYMHLKDKIGKKNEWAFPALGKGCVPFNQIFNLLKEYNNNATLSAEIEFYENKKMTLEEVNQAVKDSADYLKSLGYKL